MPTWIVTGLLCTMVGAAVIRAWGMAERSLWFDEAYSLFIARQPVREMIGLVRDYDTHPPLYYLFLHAWMALFGQGEVAVRLPSMLAGVGVVGLTFLLGRKLAGATTGVLAAVLVALSPLQVEAARQVRMYPFLALFGLSASYALWLALEAGRPRRWMAYALTLTLALYTHYLAWLLAVAHGVYVLGIRRDGVAHWMRAAGLVVVATLPLLFLASAQLPTAAHFPEVRGLPDAAALTDPKGLLRFSEALLGLGTSLRWERAPARLRLAVLAAVAVLGWLGWRAMQRGVPRSFLLTVWVLPALPVALIPLRWSPSQWASAYDQYSAFLLPPLAVLLARGGIVIAQVLRTRRAAGVAALLAVLSPLLWFDASRLADPTRATTQIDWKEVAQSISAEARLDDFILVIPAYASIAFDYYFFGPQARTVLSSREILAAHKEAGAGRLRLRTSIPPERMARVSRVHPRLWIISNVSMGPAVGRQFREALAPYFRQVSEGRTGGISVTLWESRPLRPRDER